MSCLPVKRELDQISGLPVAGDGDEKLQITGDTACASLFVGVDNQVIGVVRANLWAQLYGVRQLVASAFMVNGFRGLAIDVTGLPCDSWHVTFLASSPRINVKGGLIASCGCSAFSVNVPPSLLCPLPATDPDNPTPLSMLVKNPMPFGGKRGLLNIYSSVVHGNTATLVEGERVLSYTVAAVDDADATIDIALCGGSRETIDVPAGEQFTDDPESNLEGAGTITFSNWLSWVVETVR